MASQGRSIIFGRSNWAILEGSAEKKLAEVPPCSVQTTITSPPYYRQKDYGSAKQLGWESTVATYVDKMKTVFEELLRVTDPCGCCFFVVGDTYIGKALQLVPQRLAIVAAEVGWTIRNDLVWSRTDAAPDNAADRWRFTHEHILFLTKSPRGYKFNTDEIRVPYAGVTLKRWTNGQQYGGLKAKAEAGPQGQRFKRGKTFKLNVKGTLPRDVIECATARSKLDHFATFPLALIEKFVLATTDREDIVFDPFSGTSTTGVCAIRSGRRYLGIELNPDYTKIARNRLRAEDEATAKCAS